MSSVIPILVVVDAVGLATSGSVNGNVYIFDNEGYLGEQEGGTELSTQCSNSDILQWSIVAIQTDANVGIANFNGQAINDSIINPQLVTISDNPYWSSRVQLGANAAGTYQYSFDIVVNNTHYAFDPFLVISA